MMRKATAILMLMLLLGTACSGSDDSSDTSSGGSDAIGAPEMGRANDAPERESYDESGGDLVETEGALSGGGGSAGSYGSAAQAADRPTSLPDIQASVIKTGDLTITVPLADVDDAVRGATAVADSHGGYVVQTSMDDSDEPSASVTVRVPSQEFESSLGDLRDIGDVSSERVEGRDVSEEFVDLKARLRNLEGQEEVLLRLYDRATSVADTIRIQREVQDVQLEIERHRGRLRFLSDRTSLSTISVQFVGPDAVVAKSKPTNVIGRSWAQAKEVALAMVSAVIVSSGAVVPLALLALLIWAGFRVLGPRLHTQGK